MPPQTYSLSRRGVLYVAWPIILSNLATPLLGLVDTAVIGHLGEASLIGAIAIGSMIFSFLYWGFGFLRMGTTGLVAQAAGAGDTRAVVAAFYRALLTAIVIGFTLIAAQGPIGSFALAAVGGSPAVEAAALDYFQIRIWAAPVSLAQLAIMGFLLGTRQTRAMLFIQILLNSLNIGLDLLFVVGFGWGVAGIAAGTVIAESIALAVGLVVALRSLKALAGTLVTSLAELIDWPAIRRMLAMNGDLMIRTLSLTFGFAWFTNEGAKAGDVTLAANAILMQFVGFSAFFLDGFALTAESFVGHAVGARSKEMLKTTARLTTELALVAAVILSLTMLLVGDFAISALTNVDSVRNAAETYLIWAVAAPVVSVWCYLLDGFFIGATRTREMRNAMVVSLVVYLGAWWLTQDFGNHGLWASLLIYFAARGLTLGAGFPGLLASVEGPSSAINRGAL